MEKLSREQPKCLKGFQNDEEEHPADDTLLSGPSSGVKRHLQGQVNVSPQSGPSGYKLRLRPSNNVVETGTKKRNQICEGCGKVFIKVKQHKRFCKGLESVTANNILPIEGSQEMLINSIDELPAVPNQHTVAPEVNSNSTFVNNASDGPSNIDLIYTNSVPTVEPTLETNNNNMRAKIKACGNNCYTCPILNKSDIFTSTLTNVKYLSSNFDQDYEFLSCHSTNVIYLLTCNRCSIQYVGETVQPKMSSRMTAHIRTANKDSTEEGCRYLREHFTTGVCKDATFSVTIIEKLKGSGRDTFGSIVKEETEFRRVRERWWMSELRTIYPYGLNIRYESTFNNHENMEHNHTYNKFNSKTTKRKVRGKHKPKCISKSKNSTENVELQVDNLISLLDKLVPEVVIKARAIIFSIPKCALKNICTKFKSRFSTVDPIHIQQFDIITDLMSCKLFKKPTKVKSKKPKGSVFVNISFENKGVEMVNLPRIFHLKGVIETLPFKLKDRTADIPTVTYSYENPIRSKVLNYKKTLTDFDLTSLGNGSVPKFSDCNCASSPFIDPYHGHVITGDLSIVENSRLRNLLSKGLGYREYIPINWVKVYNTIKKSVQLMVSEWSDKKHLPRKTFDHYEITVLKMVEEQIELCKRRYSDSNSSFVPVLKDSSALKELNQLHEKYVLTPVDKTSKNIAITCKPFYLETIYKELYSNTDCDSMFGNLFTVNVYSETSLTEPEAVSKHHEHMRNIHMPFNVDKFNSLPFIYMTPKFHKVPIKFRFIVASSNCSTKPLSNAISKALKQVRLNRMYYCEKLCQYDGINRYWIIDNSKPILDCISNLNAISNAKTITTYDFSNMYTSLAHDEIMCNMQKVIEDVFTYRNKKNLSSCLSVYPSNKEDIIWSGANWVKTPRTSTFYFTKDTLVDGLKFQLDNTYFIFGKKVFSQDVGIPAGTDDGPEIANLHLHQSEYEFLNKLKKDNIYKARQLNYSYRFLDDISSINAFDKISDYAVEIYGNTIQLNKENEGQLTADVLDLTITIDPDSKTATVKLFDKRRAFKFSIVNFPDLTANISTKMSYGVIISQLLRYANACSHFSDFKSNCTLLFKVLLSQGFDALKIKLKLKTFLNNYKTCISKYNLNHNTIINEVTNEFPTDYVVSTRP